MSPDQRNRLLKLLGLTASDNDGEALNAMRAANKYLITLKTSWEKLLAGAAIEIEEDEDVGQARSLLEEASAYNLGSGDLRFVESLTAGFEEYGSLTPKQLAALQNLIGRYR